MTTQEYVYMQYKNNAVLRLLSCHSKAKVGNVNRKKLRKNRNLDYNIKITVKLLLSECKLEEPGKEKHQILSDHSEESVKS